MIMNKELKKIFIFVIIWYIIISSIFLGFHSKIVENDVMLPVVIIWLSLVILGICIAPFGSKLFDKFFKK